MLSKSFICVFWGSQLFGVRIQLCPNSAEGVLRGQKLKNYPYLNQLIDNPKLYSISKNQLLRSIKKGDMGVPPIFDLKKVLFLSQLPSKLD